MRETQNSFLKQEAGRRKLFTGPFGFTRETCIRLSTCGCMAISVHQISCSPAGFKFDANGDPAYDGSLSDPPDGAGTTIMSITAQTYLKKAHPSNVALISSKVEQRTLAVCFFAFTALSGRAFEPSIAALFAQSTPVPVKETTSPIEVGSRHWPIGTPVRVMGSHGTETVIGITDTDGSLVVGEVPSGNLGSVASAESASGGAAATNAPMATTTASPLAPASNSQSLNVFISPAGNDQNPGTLAQPVASLAQAQQLARKLKAQGLPVNVYLRTGTYYLPAPLVLTSDDSGTKAAPMVYQAYQNEKPVISGGSKLAGLSWQPYQNGIMQTRVPDDLQTDQLFVNGERQILARYPNFDPNVPIFNGHAADAISPQRVAKWTNPAGGYFHAMHPSLWGDFSYLITGKTADGQLQLTGGWQNNRPQTDQHEFLGDVPGTHHDDRFVEGIFEELDAPGEWYLNLKTHVLYFYPPAGLDLNSATIETVKLKELVEFKGTEDKPVKFISFKGLTFRQSLRTFMDTKEPIVRSDWALYRGGAIFASGTEDCSMEDSFFDQLGGNVIFVSNYNRRFTVEGCHIFRAGSNGIVFLGDPAAARNPMFSADKDGQDFHAISHDPGPQTDNYPAECLVDNCLIHETGRVEKQTAPIEIDLAQDITIRHCSIYDVPRAGINIGDGCWGGHVIEYCDIFDTVKETGDHGSYNSWGRDRWWRLKGIDLDTVINYPHPELPKLDAVKPIILRNNRWRCDHGWDIDLDDGSSNYEITNNLCLNGGIKNREGFYRVVENNIMVNSSFCPHVWYRDSQDIFEHNLVWSGYRPANMCAKPWGKVMDYNLMVKVGATGTQPATELQGASGRDEHSLVGDPLFVDAAHGDYRVKDGSPALQLGFVNFPMNQFGVQKPELAAIALTPELPGGNSAPKQLERKDDTATWHGAQIRNIRNQDEMSAYGLPGVTGILVLQVDPTSDLAKIGLKANEVILGLNGKAVDQVSDLLGAPASTNLKLKISSGQKGLEIGN